MGYVGNSPTANFASVTKDLFSGDGSTTAFTLSKAATTNGVAVFVENVRQEPTTAYAVSGTTLTFTAAPVSASGNNIYVLHHNAPASTANHPAAQPLTATSGTFSAGVSGTTGTFTSDVSIDGGSFVFNESSADKDFRVESNGQTHALFVDGGNDIIGMGVSNPTDYNSYGNGLVIDRSEQSGSSGITLVSATDGYGSIYFSDATGNVTHGAIEYGHSADAMLLKTAGTVTARFTAGRIALGIDATIHTNTMVRCDTNESDEQAFTIHASHASYATEAMNIFSARTGSTDFSYLKMHSNNNNDVEFNFKGEGTVNSDGSNNLGSGADYAEFFEWKDGNASSEDRVGYSVILDGNQIVKATSSDDTSKIIGVISGNPAVVGDTAWNKWSKKHLKDDYGRYIMEEYTVTEWYEVSIGDTGTEEKKLIQYMTDEIPSDVKVPSDATVISTEVDGVRKLKRRKVNPDWDKSKTYIPREDRKEWDIVGLTGKLRLRKGQPTGDRWIKMRDISDTVEEWLVR